MRTTWMAITALVGVSLACTGWQGAERQGSEELEAAAVPVAGARCDEPGAATCVGESLATCTNDIWEFAACANGCTPAAGALEASCAP